MLLLALFLIVFGATLTTTASVSTGKRAKARKAAARAAEAARPGKDVALAPKVILLEDVKYVPHGKTGKGPHIDWIL
jgi:hypothetical protein